jgi:hypothetical protein
VTELKPNRLKDEVVEQYDVDPERLRGATSWQVIGGLLVVCGPRRVDEWEDEGFYVGRSDPKTDAPWKARHYWRRVDSSPADVVDTADGFEMRLDAPAGEPKSRKAPRRSSGRGGFTEASMAQRRKVATLACLNCPGGPCHPAHVVSRQRGGCDHEDCVVPLCPECHRLYDDGRLDLLPLLMAKARNVRQRHAADDLEHPELGHAVGHLGPAAFQVITGRRWVAQEDAVDLAVPVSAVVLNGGEEVLAIATTVQALLDGDQVDETARPRFALTLRATRPEADGHSDQGSRAQAPADVKVAA